MDYQKKNILVTGAYQGIGKSICDYFGKEKANLIITYHEHQEETIYLKEDLERKYQIKVSIFYLDLSDEESINNLYNEVKEKYQKLDILINNAAISLDSFIPDKTKKEFMKVLEINVVGTFLMMKSFDNIIDNGYIFNISSTDGMDTGNIYSIDYNASKAAINNITLTFSLYSHNTIISLCPNWVDTESTRCMDKYYLENELKRVHQKELINPIEIPKMIDRCIKNNIETGSIIRIEGVENE